METLKINDNDIDIMELFIVPYNKKRWVVVSIDIGRCHPKSKRRK
ncbi:hypothetical protein CLCAR_3698 [Clostridium carboxidivorans P7]|nr:hypothetical protein [Clostridium carboxidivorans]EFG86742.1 hypothetical protein CLCAR_3698 [Clostridium carboxidivorans P7]